MDGYEASLRIRALNLPQHVPIIALTANAMKEDRQRCIVAGMDDYLSKPYNKDKLQERLEFWLAPRSTQHITHRQ
jgi:CheY-like chemotaxis protein